MPEGLTPLINADFASAANGANAIAGERVRQILKGYTAAHDDRREDGALWKAAGAVLSHGQDVRFEYMVKPVDSKWIDSLVDVRRDRIRQLAVAGALIAAEIDRLNRLAGNVPPARAVHDIPVESDTMNFGHRDVPPMAPRSIQQL